MSDYRLCTVSGSPAPDPATGLCVVTDETGTVIGPIPALCELPEAGWLVWVEIRGAKRQDWVITDIQTPTSIRRTFSRYAVAKTGLGIAAGAIVDIGSLPTTPWTTGSIVGGNTSRLTINVDCHIDLFASVFTGQFGLHMLFTTATASGADAYGPTTQGGGVYDQAERFSGLVLAGETIDITARNLAGGLQDLHAKTYVTLCDAHWVVAQT